MKPIQFWTWINLCEKCNNKLYGLEYKDKIVFKCRKCNSVTIIKKEVKKCQ